MKKLFLGLLVVPGVAFAIAPGGKSADGLQSPQLKNQVEIASNLARDLKNQVAEEISNIVIAKGDLSSQVFAATVSDKSILSIAQYLTSVVGSIADNVAIQNAGLKDDYVEFVKAVSGATLLSGQDLKLKSNLTLANIYEAVDALTVHLIFTLNQINKKR